MFLAETRMGLVEMCLFDNKNKAKNVWGLVLFKTNK